MVVHLTEQSFNTKLTKLTKNSGVVLTPLSFVAFVIFALKASGTVVTD